MPRVDNSPQIYSDITDAKNSAQAEIDKNQGILDKNASALDSAISNFNQSQYELVSLAQNSGSSNTQSSYFLDNVKPSNDTTWMYVIAGAVAYYLLF